MADIKTWKLSEIRELWRIMTGRRSTSQISDADVNKEINDYYVNHFSNDAKVDEFNDFYTQELSATDDGVYDITENIDRFDDPATINGNQILLYRDRELFFGGNDSNLRNTTRFGFLSSPHNTFNRKFEDEQYITNPTLVIGSSDTAKVKNSDFSYSINDFSYSKLSSEVDLTGNAIPSGKYGAWSLKIDTDGDITVAAATGNATGYDTPRLALDALDSSDSESAYMGYVTVTKSDGAFTPATTTLDATNVTATFTDGRFETRTTPVSALLYGQKLYINPKPNDILQFKVLTIADRPTAFADDNSIPQDPKWGPVIASKSAALFLVRNGENASGAREVTTEYMKSIELDQIKRLLGQEVQRSN